MNKFEFIGSGVKNILIISGVHGDELTPIYTTYLLSKTPNILDKSKYKKLTILNAINLSGIKLWQREIDSNNSNDLNRMFSNENKCEPYELLKKYFDDYDYDIIIDIHSSPNCDEFVLLNNDEYSNSYVEFCEKNSIHYLLQYNSNDTIKKYCYENNKISFTIEINKMNSIDYDSSEACVSLIRKIIDNVNDFKIKIEEPKYRIKKEIRTHKSGMFIPIHKCGDLIFDGLNLGKIIDLHDFKKYELIYHGENSIIIDSYDVSYVDANIVLYEIQPINNL
jgi:succinylglutamate desuccinylase